MSLENLSGGDAKLRIASAIAGLNASDIESFKVLKEGSAVAVYGPRAIAGVVLITTKKGSAGTASITYTNESTYRVIPSYNNFNLLNSQEHMSVLQEMADGGTLIEANQKQTGVYSRMYEMLYELDANGNPLLANTQAARNGYLREAERRNTDWFSKIYQSNIVQNHSISLSTGTEKATYYASLSMLNDPGFVKKSYLNNCIGTLNANYFITPKLRLNIITNASYRNRRYAGAYSDMATYALNTSRTMSPTETYKLNYAPFNVLTELEENYKINNRSDIKLQGQLSYQIHPKLDLSVLGSVRYLSRTTIHNMTERSNEAQSWRAMQTATVMSGNSNLYTDPYIENVLPITVLPEGGFRDKSEDQSFATNFRATFNYKNTFGKKLIL